MAGIRSRNTKPEVLVRKLLHNAGYRFRLGSKIGRIKPDIVLRRWRAAIFIHGCFWHGHNQCHLYRLPKSNPEFWSGKITINKERDERTYDALRDAGWNVITVWECALKGRRRLTDLELLEKLNARIHDWSRPDEINGTSDRTAQSPLRR
jgi:DNA mismatch endonuclease (patch repair protein)